MSTDESDSVSRRGFLRAATGAAAATATAGQAAASEGKGSSGGATKTVLVGPGGSLVFEPAELKITPGTTVKFVFKSDGHNVVVGEQPEGASWKGTKGGPGKLYDTGHVYKHTFETKGTYQYWCQPHKTAGMTGTIKVVESIQTEGGGGGPSIPDSARTLGIASIIGMLSTLGLAFFFLKYGGDYETPEE